VKCKLFVTKSGGERSVTNTTRILSDLFTVKFKVYQFFFKKIAQNLEKINKNAAYKNSTVIPRLTSDPTNECFG